MGHVGEETQITCRFVTKLPDEYRVPLSSVAVPSKLTRYGLSQVINHLLALDPVRPFDFLVNGELVRLSLEKFLLARNISAESVLEVEFIFAVEPPLERSQHPHDEWISAVASRDRIKLSGAYDGVLRTWPGDAAAASSSTLLHTGPIKALAVLPEAQGHLVLTAGQDQRLLLTDAPALAASNGAAAPPASVIATYRDHEDAVAALAASPSGDSFASGSWDASVRIWPTGAEAAREAAAAGSEEAVREASAKKRRKGGGGGGNAALPSAPVELRSRARLEGHTQCVSSVAWPAAGSAVSGSWDHSVRRWDVETGANTETRSGGRAVYCVAAAAGNAAGAVAFGGAERALRIWDPRAPVAADTDQKQLLSHTDWISALAWHPSAPHTLASASYDGSVKLWDLRSAIPLHTLQGHSDKALCVAWAGPEQLVSGGADCKLLTYTVTM